MATVPPRAPGAANVTLRTNGNVIEGRAALRYIDPDATPDPSLSERVLIPVLFNGPGAFGSQWVTEVEMLNRTPRALTRLPACRRRSRRWRRTGEHRCPASAIVRQG